MFRKNNLKYILLLGIGFLWCSLVYLIQEQCLLNYLPIDKVNIVDMVFANICMAIGIYIFSKSFRKDIKKIYYYLLIVSIVLSIMFFLFNNSIVLSAILCLVCLIGSSGFGVGYHFALITSNVEKKYRGKVFALGYSIGIIGTWLISMLPNICGAKSLLIIIPLILINVYLVSICGNIKIGTEKKKIRYKYLIVLVIVLGIISSMSSNTIALSLLNENYNFAYSRIYYAFGLIIAGIIADKKREYIEIATIFSSFFPLLVFLLFKEQIPVVMISSLNYFFLAFYVMFRTTSFMNLTDNKNSFIQYAAYGLLISRLIEGTFSLFVNHLKFDYLYNIIVILILLCVAIYVYIFKYNKNSDIDILKQLSIKYQLSSQETKVLELLINDYTNKEMAEKLFLSANTVRNHIASIYRKTGMQKKQLKEVYTYKTI